MSELEVTQFSKEEIVKSLPKKYAKSITDNMVEKINGALNSSIAEPFEENFISMAEVLMSGRYKISNYINAVKFVSYRLMDVSVVDAWARCFPVKYKQLVDSGTSRDGISSFSSAYNQGKLVTSIFSRSLIPVHVLNADIHQKAINKLASVMTDDEASFRNQIDAASALLTHLKPPEESILTIDVTAKGSEALDDLKAITRELAFQQKQILETGEVKASEIAKSRIIKTIAATDN